jgi:SlyX protein
MTDTMNQSLEHRLTELETRIAFLEHTVQTLDAAVATQDRCVNRLQREFELLRGELGQVKVALSHDMRNEPAPPHY